MTTTTELIEYAIHNENSYEYKYNQSYNFKGRKTLFDALTKESISAADIIKWELQLADCIKYEYMTNQNCPEYIDPKMIFVDGNKDVIYHTVVFSKQPNSIRNDIKYMDCLIRIHCTLFNSVHEYNIFPSTTNELTLLHILGKYFYAAIISGSSKCNVLRIYEFIEQMKDMVELGLFKDLSAILPK